MPISMNGKTIGSVFCGSTPIAEVYRGATLVWQNVPKVTISQISDVWTKIKESNNFPRNDGRYWTRSDQLVTGVPNWNEYPLQEVPYRLVLAPGFTAGQGMFSSYLGGYPATNKLVTAPEMDTQYLTDMTAFFWNAVNLENIPEYTITVCRSIKDFVGNCPKVKSVVLRDCGNVQDVRNAFGAGSETMPACTHVELHGLGPSLPNGHVVDLSKTALTADGATELFDSLGTVTSGRTVTLKLPDSALGVSQGLARDKGWTVTPFVDEAVITGTSGFEARDSFRAALTARGLDYRTVETVPFLLGTSQVTNMYAMFSGCSSLTSVPDMNTVNVTYMNSMFQNCAALTSVPDMDTSQVTRMSSTFYNCAALTDGNVRCIGKNADVNTKSMILDSGLTRLPFYDTDGNWTG